MSETTRTRTVKVAAIQGSSKMGAVEENTEKFVELVRTAARGGAKIVVLPEMAITGYLSQDLKETWSVPGRPVRKSPATRETFERKNPEGAAEEVPGGTTTRRFGEVAKELGIFVSVTLCEKSKRGREAGLNDEDDPPGREWVFFNTACLMGPDGEIACKYRKTNLWPYVDRAWLTAGHGVATAQTPWGRVGLAVCFDAHVMLDRYAALSRGIWALLYSVAWVGSTDDWFVHTLPPHVARCGYHVVAANWSVDDPRMDSRPGAEWEGAGGSTIISMDGKILSSATGKYGSTIVFADLPY